MKIGIVYKKDLFGIVKFVKAYRHCGMAKKYAESKNVKGIKVYDFMQVELSEETANDSQ